MFDPAGFRVNLLVLFLSYTDHRAGMIEDHAAGAGRTLIYCRNKLCHFYASRAKIEKV